MITAKRLRERLNYDPLTGIFTWKVKVAKRLNIGDIAGSAYRNKYWHIRIDGRLINAHRLAWLYMTGKLPTEQIDHINMDGLDNRFENLREATRSQNRANTPNQKNSKCALKGVSRASKYKWMANIKHKKARYYLGVFDTPELAHEAYVKAAKKYYGEFAHYK